MVEAVAVRRSRLPVAETMGLVAGAVEHVVGGEVDQASAGQTAGPGQNKGSCAAALTPPARQVHLTVLAAFAETGRPPARGELERIARADGADPAAVLAELAESDVIAFDADGEIRAAYPFSPTPTPIRVSWEGGPVAYAPTVH